MLLVAEVLALLGFCIGAYGLYRRYRATEGRVLPADRSALKGDPAKGVRYAFTTGMMPWAKESTRIHLVAYLRGIGFHLGIFAAFGVTLLMPWSAALPESVRMLLLATLAAGAVLGAAGGVMRVVVPDLRRLSVPDDHFAVWLVTLFMAAGSAALANPAFAIPFYVASAVTFAYVPLGKIRHCLYYFFSRFFFGKFFGRRAVLPHPEVIR